MTADHDEAIGIAKELVSARPGHYAPNVVAVARAYLDLVEPVMSSTGTVTINAVGRWAKVRDAWDVAEEDRRRDAP